MTTFVSSHIISYNLCVNRAGRDGLPAYSLLYFSKRDVSTFEYLARMKKSKQKDANVHALGALEKMVDYCTKTCCRRQYLLKFFGEKETDPKAVCQKSCDFCRNPEKVTRAIEASSCVNDFVFQKAAAKEWDGQWSAPHGDGDAEDDDDDDMDKVGLSKSNGLSLMGEDVADFGAPSSYSQNGTGGFSKASDILAKYEVRSGGFPTLTFCLGDETFHRLILVLSVHRHRRSGAWRRALVTENEESQQPTLCRRI